MQPQGTALWQYPSVFYRGEQWTKPEKSAKTLPPDIERRFFPDTRITAYRLAA